MRALSVNEINYVCGAYKTDREIWEDFKSESKQAWDGLTNGMTAGTLVGSPFGLSAVGAVVGGVVGVAISVHDMQTAARDKYENYSNEGRSSIADQKGGLKEKSLPIEVNLDVM
jgi:hypothetical protein